MNVKTMDHFKAIKRLKKVVKQIEAVAYNPIPETTIVNRHDIVQFSILTVSTEGALVNIFTTTIPANEIYQSADIPIAPDTAAFRIVAKSMGER